MKTKVPNDIFKKIKDFWERNKHKEVPEQYSTGYTIVNFWDAPAYMVSFEDDNIPEGRSVKVQVWEGIRSIVEEWVGRAVYETSLYGVRKYTNGSILATRK